MMLLVHPDVQGDGPGHQGTRHQGLNHLDDDLSSLPDSCLFQFHCLLQLLGDALMVFDEMSLKPLQRYWIALANANFSKGSPSSLVGRDGRPFLVSQSLVALAR